MGNEVNCQRAYAVQGLGIYHNRVHLGNKARNKADACLASAWSSVSMLDPGKDILKFGSHSSGKSYFFVAVGNVQAL